MIYSIRLLTSHSVTLLYLSDDGSIQYQELHPSDVLYINDDSIDRYLNLMGMLDPSMNLIQIRKEG